MRWFDSSGREVALSEIDALLPVALGSSGNLPRKVRLDVEVGPGLYRLEVSRAAAPERVLSSTVLRIR